MKQVVTGSYEFEYKVTRFKSRFGFPEVSEIRGRKQIQTFYSQPVPQKIWTENLKQETNRSLRRNRIWHTEKMLKPIAV